MKIIYRKLENAFEKFSSVATKVLGNSITFIIALSVVLLYFTDKRVIQQPGNKTIMDVIFATTFLSIFIIQKSVNRFSTALHLKINELVAAHDKASNRMINVEEKTEEEMDQLTKQYSNLADTGKSSADIHASKSIENILDAGKENSGDNPPHKK
jgi:low affinity Fe/Cu permease